MKETHVESMKEEREERRGIWGSRIAFWLPFARHNQLAGCNVVRGQKLQASRHHHLDLNNITRAMSTSEHMLGLEKAVNSSQQSKLFPA